MLYLVLFSLNPLLLLKTLLILKLLKIKTMFFSEALCGILPFMSSNLVPVKGIRLEVATQDSQVDVKEAKKPLQVSILL